MTVRCPEGRGIASHKLDCSRDPESRERRIARIATIGGTALLIYLVICSMVIPSMEGTWP